MSTCGQCGGAIMTPGLSYGYAGPVCMCSWRTPVTPMPQAQIDEALVLAIEADKREIERLRADLSASQAREKVLRDGWRAMDEAARDIRRQHLENKEGDVYHAMQWLSVTHGPMLKDIPADDTALREMLVEAQEEMRERCAATCERIAVKHVDAEMEGLADGSWDDSDHYRSSGDWRTTAENHAKATGWMMLQCAAAIRKLEVKP